MQSSPIQFHVSTSSGTPIYRQLMDQVLIQVASGRLVTGAMLPSVRDVALELQVNPMTVSKAYSLLEREGVVERVRGQGMRVNAAERFGGVKERQQQLVPLLQQVVAAAYQLQLSREQLLAVLKPLLKELPDE